MKLPSLCVLISKASLFSAFNCLHRVDVTSTSNLIFLFLSIQMDNVGDSHDSMDEAALLLHQSFSAS